MMCSSDREGFLAFWDADRDEFESKGPVFTCDLMKSGIESLAVEGTHLVCSTCEGHALLFQLLENQQTIVREKVYPVGYTLLHALTDIGDLKAIQVLFNLAGKEPLGFTLDADM